MRSRRSKRLMVQTLRRGHQAAWPPWRIERKDHRTVRASVRKDSNR